MNLISCSPFSGSCKICYLAVCWFAIQCFLVNRWCHQVLYNFEGCVWLDINATGGFCLQGKCNTLCLFCFLNKKIADCFYVILHIVWQTNCVSKSTKQTRTNISYAQKTLLHWQQFLLHCVLNEPKYQTHPKPIHVSLSLEFSCIYFRIWCWRACQN